MTDNKQSTNATKKPRSTKKPHGIAGGSREANRLAVVILEVLAGVRSPSEAAKILEITKPRYYQLETRALIGLVEALEPRPMGKQPSPETRIAKLERELAESHRECGRQQALVRAAQRTLGIRSAPQSQAKQTAKDSAGRKKRRPTVRALKAAKVLAVDTGAENEEPLQQGNPTGGTMERPPVETGKAPGGVPGAVQGTKG